MVTSEARQSTMTQYIKFPLAVSSFQCPSFQMGQFVSDMERFKILAKSYNINFMELRYCCIRKPIETPFVTFTRGPGT